MQASGPECAREEPAPAPDSSHAPCRRFQFGLGALHGMVLACAAFCTLTLSLHVFGAVLFLLLLGGALLGLACWRREHWADRRLAMALLWYAVANIVALLVANDIRWGVPIYVFFVFLGPLLGSFVVLVLHLAHWSIRFSGLALSGFFVVVSGAVLLNLYAFIAYLALASGA